MHVLTLVATNF